MSQHSKVYKQDDLILTAQVSAEEDGWSLLLIDKDGNGTAWEDPFDSVESAFCEAEAAIAEQGIAFFIGHPDFSELLGQDSSPKDH